MDNAEKPLTKDLRGVGNAELLLDAIGTHNDFGKLKVSDGESVYTSSFCPSKSQQHVLEEDHHHNPTTNFVPVDQTKKSNYVEHGNITKELTNATNTVTEDRETPNASPAPPEDELMFRESVVPQSLRSYVQQMQGDLNDRKASFDALWQAFDHEAFMKRRNSRSSSATDFSSVIMEEPLDQRSEISSVSNQGGEKEVQPCHDKNNDKKDDVIHQDQTTPSTSILPTSNSTDKKGEQLEAVSEDLHDFVNQAHHTLHARKVSFDAILEDYLKNAREELDATVVDDDENNSILGNTTTPSIDDDVDHDDDMDTDSLALEILQADMNIINAQHASDKTTLMDTLENLTTDAQPLLYNEKDQKDKNRDGEVDVSNAIHLKTGEEDVDDIDIYNDGQKSPSLYLLEKRSHNGEPDMEECLEKCWNPCVIL